MDRLKKRIAAGLITLSLFLCACQPTPETPPVIYRGEGLPEGCVIDPVPEGQKKEIDAPEHWTEEAYRTNKLVKINADADIVIPDISNTPVIELAQKPLTVDELKGLSAYFAGDRKLYNKPEMTKAELEFQLEQLQNRKGEYGVSYNNSVVPEAENRLKKLIDIAPDTIEKEYTDIVFSYPQKNLSESIWMKYDQKEGEQEQLAKTDFEAIVETGGAVEPEIYAVTYNEQAGTSSSFSYSKGSYITAERLQRYRTSIEYARGVEGTKWEQDSKVTDAFESYFYRIEDVLSKNAGTEEQARRVAEEVLKDLGISYMALASVEKGIALNIPFSRWDKEVDTEVAQGAYILTCFREVGGLVGFHPSFAASYDSLPEQVYKPPFLPEKITMVVTDEGLYAFLWENMSEEVGTVAANTIPLSFDKVKERFLEHIGYVIALHGLPPEEDYLYRYDVYRVQLRSFPSTAYNQPNRAWMIPVWVFYMEHYSKYGEEDVLLVDEEVMINALDGGFVSPE